MSPSKNVIALNLLLAQELGRNPYGEGLFQWNFSNDLFWPAEPTGKMVAKPIEIPIIGGGAETHQVLEPEYKKRPMSLKLSNQWVVTRWLPPAVWAGLTIDTKIGNLRQDFPESMIIEAWQRRFPKMDYPARGMRMFTDWANKPFLEPTLQDTRLLIAQLREQLSGMSLSARLADMELDQQRKEERITKITEDIAEDSFTALLNPNPGKKGGFVSFPSVETSVGK